MTATEPASPPPRMADDPSISASLSADLGAYAASSGPEYDVSAGLARFQATLTPGMSGAEAGASIAQSAATGIGVKVAGIVLLSAAALGIGAAWLRHDSSASTGVGASNSERSDNFDAPLPQADPDPDATRSASMILPSTESDAHVKSSSSGNLPRATRKHHSRSRRDKSNADPNVEAQAVNQARRELAKDEPRRTLATLRRLDQSHPRGLLEPERSALKAFALHRLGKTRAAELEARRFLKRHPQSPLADRVRAILARAAK